MSLVRCLAVMLSAVPPDAHLAAPPLPVALSDTVSEASVPAAPPLPPPPDGAVLSAKYGDGVTFEQGEFRLNLRGRIQVQGLSAFPTEDSGAKRQNAIFVRRARLALKGDFPWHLSVNLQLAFSVLDMEPDQPNVLRDFNVQWAPLRDLSFRLGQMKVPFDVQRVISSSALQFADRSLITGELNLDRDVGLVVYSEDLFGLNERLRYWVGVFGGDGRNRVGTNVGLLYSARVRFAPFGAIDDKLEGDPERDPRFRLAIGGGVARNVQTNRPRSTIGDPFEVATFNYTHAAGDLHLKWRGFSLLSEFYWRQADSDSVTSVVSGAPVTEYSRSGWGWFAQAGYYFTPWLELAGRYGDLRPIGSTDPNLKRTIEAGGTVNLMFLKHDLKLQTDFFWVGEEGRERLQLRLQAQVFF